MMKPPTPRAAAPLRSVDALLRHLRLDRSTSPWGLSEDREFGCLVPRAYAARMLPGDWHDPLLRQVLPLADEKARTPGFAVDPVGDSLAMAARGLLHKYRSRVLLLATGACAVHCRYCFRRSFPFRANLPTARDIARVWQYLREHPEVDELVLSGGDPLMLPAACLTALLAPLATVPHVRTVRFHTRVPIVDPQRVGAAHRQLIRTLSLRGPCVVVVHANCAEEISPRVRVTLGQIRRAGATLLNQAVLLKGVNDSVDAQESLARTLFAAGVVPYYLHQLDRAVGTAHFEVSEHNGRRILRELRRRLPGYLVPRYVREIEGRDCKSLLA
jgi:L-lysine 2,3-aminomutase